MYESLADKVVLVTGAAGGIGRAIAERFAGQGCQGRRQRRRCRRPPPRSSRRSSTRGGTAMAAVADVSDSDAGRSDVRHSSSAEYGHIDVLVNNAGLVSPMLHFFEADEAWWRRIIDVNLTGHFLCSHVAARMMAKAGGGCIINMSSGGATRAHRAFTAYDATKGGIEALTRAMALDLGPYGIRVNALMPGSIDTSGLSLDDRQVARRERAARADRRADRHDRRGAVPRLRRCLLHHRRRDQGRRRHARPAAVGHGRHQAAVGLPACRGSVTVEPGVGHWM